MAAGDGVHAVGLKWCGVNECMKENSTRRTFIWKGQKTIKTIHHRSPPTGKNFFLAKFYVPKYQNLRPTNVFIQEKLFGQVCCPQIQNFWPTNVSTQLIVYLNQRAQNNPAEVDQQQLLPSTTTHFCAHPDSWGARRGGECLATNVSARAPRPPVYTMPPQNCPLPPLQEENPSGWMMAGEDFRNWPISKYYYVWLHPAMDDNQII